MDINNLTLEDLVNAYKYLKKQDEIRNDEEIRRSIRVAAEAKVMFADLAMRQRHIGECFASEVTDQSGTTITLSRVKGAYIVIDGILPQITTMEQFNSLRDYRPGLRWEIRFELEELMYQTYAKESTENYGFIHAKYWANTNQECENFFLNHKRYSVKLEDFNRAVANAKQSLNDFYGIMKWTNRTEIKA